MSTLVRYNPPPTRTLGRRGPALRRARLGPVSVLLFAAAVSLPSAASAARLRVQARVRIALQIEESGGRILVRGRLSDVRDQPVSGAAVALEIVPVGAVGAERLAPESERSAVARSNASGRFEHGFARLSLPPGQIDVAVAARFSGDGRFAAADAQIDGSLGVPTPTLRLQVRPAAARSDEPGFSAVVNLEVGDLPLPGRVIELRIGAEVVATAATDALGEARFELEPATVGRLGPMQLSARAPSDGSFGAAEASTTIQLEAAVRVSLEVATSGGSPQCDEDVVCLQGVVSVVQPDGTLRAPTAAAVHLHAERTRLGALRADPSGRFEARLRRDVLMDLFPPGPIGVVAEVVVGEAFHPPGWSEVVAIDVPPRPSPFAAIYGALIAALIGAFVWRRWRDRRVERQAADDLAASSAGLPPVAVRSLGTGGDGMRIRAVVIHGEHGGVLGARVTLEQPGTPATVVDADDGRVRFVGLQPGPASLTVDAPGHELLLVELTLPHDGTFDGCELLPTSSRAAVRGSLSARIGAASGRPVDWSRETPRRAEPRWLAARRRGHARIRAAVRAVEDALYGRRLERDTAAQVMRQVEGAEEAE